jgi:hypothetical protein
MGLGVGRQKKKKKLRFGENFDNLIYLPFFRKLKSIDSLKVSEFSNLSQYFWLPRRRIFSKIKEKSFVFIMYFIDVESYNRHVFSFSRSLVESDLKLCPYYFVEKPYKFLSSFSAKFRQSRNGSNLILKGILTFLMKLIRIKQGWPPTYPRPKLGSKFDDFSGFSSVFDIKWPKKPLIFGNFS